jgi:hypothetical protein
MEKRASLLGVVCLSLIVGACGSSSVQVQGDGGGGGDPPPSIDTGTPGDSGLGRPPVVSGGATRWFAVQVFRLGLTSMSTGVPSPNAWKDYGFDLDGRMTSAEDSKTSNDTCKRRPGSPTSILADGNGGIDDNFGGHVMQVMHSLKSDTEDAVNSSVAGGATTMLLRLDNVGPADNGSVPGALYVAGSLGRPPAFTEADAWPVTSDSLLDGATVGAARFSFPRGYMRGGYWVSDDLGAATAELPLPLFAQLAPVKLASAIVTFDMRGAGTGMIGGAADIPALQAAMTPGIIQFGICPGNATFDQIVETMQQSADVVLGAPRLQDTSVECNGISLGIGFLARPTGAPTRVVPPTPLPSTCPTG